MTHHIRLLCALILVEAVAVAGSAGAASETGVLTALKGRHPLSRIEVQDPRYTGAVIARGAVLTLDGEGVPANRLRVIRANTKSPRFHVADYARVDVTPDGALRAGGGDFALPTGSRLVVLDLKVEPDRVRLFTHTAEPVALSGGTAAYGCTEFVFHFGREGLEGADVAQIEKRIERRLPFKG